MVLPLLKLAFLAVKQAAKPIANQIKTSAVNSGAIKSTLLRVGRRLNYNVIQINRLAEGQPLLKRERVPVLNEKDALTKGSDFLAEMVVYGISAGVLGAEYVISSRKAMAAEAQKAERKAKKDAEAAKNEARQWDEFRKLNLRLIEMQGRLEALEEAEKMRRLQGEGQGWFGRYR